MPTLVFKLCSRWICCFYCLFFLGASPVVANSFIEGIVDQDVDAVSAALQKLPRESIQNQLALRLSNGDTPLLFSARQNNLVLVDMLLKAGANPNAMDPIDRDILNISVSVGNPEMAKLAIAAGADVTLVTSTYEGSALIYATHQGEVDIAKMLIAAGAPLDRVNNLGWTALLEATILGNGGKAHQEIVAALLSAGADRHIADRSGLTPLAHAKSRGHDEIVALLENE